MDTFDDTQITALQKLDQLIDLAADLREMLEQSGDQRRKPSVVQQSMDELDELKNSFVAIISHELRTPVGVVSNGVELLERRLNGRLDPLEEELIASVRAQSRQLATLVRELTEFNDLSSSHQGPLIEDALRLAVESAVENVHVVAERRGIDLRVVGTDQVPGYHSDSARLRVVLENLLANAVRFTPDGGLVELSIDHDADQIVIRVRDSGAGIPPAQLARIFDSFRQAEDPHTRHYGGLGLGLSIIQRAISTMGGRITVESTMGVGSTFSVILPSNGTPQPEHPAPNEDLRSTLFGHIQRLQSRIDMNQRYMANLESQLDAWRIFADRKQYALALVDASGHLVFANSQMHYLMGWSSRPDGTLGELLGGSADPGELPALLKQALPNHSFSLLAAPSGWNFVLQE